MYEKWSDIKQFTVHTDYAPDKLSKCCICYLWVAYILMKETELAYNRGFQILWWCNKLK
jgi:hypothetical protein